MSDRDLLHALRVPFEETHILINRTQCATSVYAADVEERSERPPFYREVIHLSGFTLSLFDLQSYLKSTFRLASPTPARLVLILPLDRIHEETAEMLRNGPLHDVERDQLAIRVSSETEMRSIEISQLRPLGVTMRRRLVEHGVVAVHPEERSFGFLIDLDAVVRLSLRGAA